MWLSTGLRLISSKAKRVGPRVLRCELRMPGQSQRGLWAAKKLFGAGVEFLDNSFQSI
jgi:hypothetical protein